MHDSAYRIGELVMRTYSDLPNAKILEVGSLNVNGCLRDAAAPNTHYVGLDLEEGPSVDLVITPGAAFPVADDSFDLVMASSVFEHDARFWDTFVRMCRAARAGGHIYVNAPSNGTVHRYPMDCWRFYPDAGLALVEHARGEGLEIDLVESFIGNRHSDVWNDFVAVFRKGPSVEPLNTAFVYQRYPSLNARTWQSRVVYNESDRTEDMAIIDDLRRQCEDLHKLGQAREELVQAQQERDKLADDLARLSRSLTETQQHSDRVLENNEHLNGRVADLGGELQRYQDELDQARVASVESTARLSIALAEAEQSRNHATADNEHLRNKITLLESGIEQHRQEIERTRSALTEVHVQHDALVEDRTRLSGSLAQVEQERDQASSYRANLQGEMTILESNLRQRQEEIEQAWAQVAELTAQGARLRDTITELQTVQGKLETKLADSDGWVFDLAGERRALEGRLATVQMELQQARRSITRMEALDSFRQQMPQHNGTMSRQVLEGIARLQGLEGTPDVLLAQTEHLQQEWSKEKHPLAGVVAIVHTLARTMQGTANQKAGLHRDIEILMDRLDQAPSINPSEAELVTKLTETIASLRTEALNYHARAAEALEQLEALRAEYKQQARALHTLEDRAAKKDVDLTWLRRLYQLLELESGWNTILPPRMRRRRIGQMLRRNGLFDADAYLTKYPDVVEADMDPLRHYVLHGMAEGREVDRPV